MKKIIILIVFITTIQANPIKAQISLDKVLSQVVQKSFAVKTAVNQKLTVASDYKFFQSQLKPNVGLNASIPNYSKTSSPILQPDGTISFQPIRQANSSLSLFATQVLPSTGGLVFANSDLRRFDDFSLKASGYNGIPLRIGIVQPLFGFNAWKYEKEIQPMLIEESKLNYNIQVELALLEATNLYFNILTAEQNLEIALTNEQVNQKLLVITKERLNLGKVSRDEKLQLEIELNNAKLSVIQARFELNESKSYLKIFLGNNNSFENTEFLMPENIVFDQINITKLTDAYKNNRPEILAFQRSSLESERDLAKAKTDFGWNANLQASIGLARGSNQLAEIYTNPFDEQQFNISLQIPILDWGKKKVAMERINIQQLDMEAQYKQNLLEIENDIRQQSALLLRLQKEIFLIEGIMKKADERFVISNERYVLGNISITNLTLAQREKDQAKRNYINALRSYWSTYYNLRVLSGYDILKNENIQYN